MTSVTFRDITAGDAVLVAALHAASWRSAYRGILSDAYLASDVDFERAEFWRQRLGVLSDADHFGLIAMHHGAPIGFVFVTRDADPIWGSLIDNLHVSAAMRSAGIGQRLLVAAADGIATRRWGHRVHLWVYDANVRARAFYARLGGTEVEGRVKAVPDGSRASTWRVAWDDLEHLRAVPPRTAGIADALLVPLDVDAQLDLLRTEERDRAQDTREPWR